MFKMMEVCRHKSMDTLRGYVRRADLFRDHAGRRSYDPFAFGLPDRRLARCPHLAATLRRRPPPRLLMCIRLPPANSITRG